MDRIRTPGIDAHELVEVRDASVGADDALDVSLRPRALDEFVGQEELRDQLEVSLQAAQRRGEALDHVLLSGPPGLGKTSLARIVAEELDVPFTATAGPALERGADLAAILTSLEPRSVLFVDEVHRLARALEEILYPAMEDRELPVTMGTGPGAKVVTLPLPPFTLIGATTRAGLLTRPFRDRFGIQHRLEHYDPAELARIVVRSARVLGIEVDAAGARAIAERSRGTPRVANRLLKRVRDYAEVRGSGAVDDVTATEALHRLGVDERGLDRLDRELLEAICVHYAGGPVGLSTLAARLGEEADTIEDVYEPYLLRQGLLQKTARGRVATAHAFAHLGMPAPEHQQALPGLP